MTGAVAHIWRYPIKAHGAEELASVTLTAGTTMPWDRTWAIAHDAAKADDPATWAPCQNFSRGAKAPSLMAISATLDTETEMLTLSHPDRSDLTVHPERDAAKLIDWVAPLMPANRAQSARVYRPGTRGMTDTDYASVSLINLASNREIGEKLGQELTPRRWRCNFWLEGLRPWEEFDWIGKTLMIGEAELKVEARIVRCLATTANPDTGTRDADTLGALRDGWGHQDFGVYATVTNGGLIRAGDTLRVV